ncbi:hypothetical protein KA531_02205 [Candidatus Saccharibacteria bacterium]|nr:hypothetical protein [Candidatus Saccharibacteria bacterium]
MLKPRASLDNSVRIRTTKRNVNQYHTQRLKGTGLEQSWLEIRTKLLLTSSILILILISFLSLGLRSQSISKYYMSTQFEAGGVYREGVIGDIQIINPILAKTSTDRDLTHLIFSGLTRFSQYGKIEPDLATSWEIDPSGLVYTFHLRNDVKWHDGHPFSARDVDFTLTAIQNPDSRSNLQTDWQNVTHRVIDQNTIEITLPTQINNFINQTTVGIIPSHLLESVEPDKLRFHSFNLAPIGTGAFKYQDYKDNNLIILNKNQEYYHADPYLDQIQIQTFQDKDALLLAYSQNQIDSFSGLNLDFEPEYTFKLRQNSYIGLFLNNSHELFNSPERRLAFEQLVNKAELLNITNLNDKAIPINYPVFSDQEGYNDMLEKRNFDPALALDQLKQSGLTPDQVSYKLVTTSSLVPVAQALGQQLIGYGIKIDIDLINNQQKFNDTIASRDYDILLFGQNTGSDSDVYSFWHSSQADFAGTNLANYKNPESDRLLESARLDPNPESRAKKISNFLAIWQSDTASVILYRPYYLIYSRIDLQIPIYKIITPSNRFDFAYLWKIQTSAHPQVKL